MQEPSSILQKGVEQHLHPGAQLYVVHRGRVVIDFACGEARLGVPLHVDSLMQWFSSGKPLTAICLAQLYDAGEILLEDRIARFIPEFALHGKEALTFWNLLTHTAGFRSAENISRHIEWPEVIRLICESPLDSGWKPGEKAAYSPQASWFILAEVIQRITNISFPEYIRRELLVPLQMNDAWLSLPLQESERYGDRVARMFDTQGGKQSLGPLQDPAGMAICRPGATARGPIRELARFYSMLLHGGELDGRRYLRRETVALWTRRHREGLYDHTFGHTLDFGLGFMINSNRYGAATVPYGYGMHASDDTFGHSGAQSSCAFADPKHELIVGWVTNGLPGERAHQIRQREVNNAIYEQLGLASAN